MRAEQSGPLRFEEWEQAVLDAGAPKREFLLLREYKYAGSRDVYFYQNRVSEACFWDQPDAWLVEDKVTQPSTF